jgi:hypothetical protein
MDGMGLVREIQQKTHGHKGQATALLGIHPHTLTRMMRRDGMPESCYMGPAPWRAPHHCL